MVKVLRNEIYFLLKLLEGFDGIFWGVYLKWFGDINGVPEGSQQHTLVLRHFEIRRLMIKPSQTKSNVVKSSQA